jgi:transposase
MTTTLQEQAYEVGKVLSMALELSAKKWKLAFSRGDERVRQRTIEAGEVAQLVAEVGLAKQRLGLLADCRVVSCYEAGRDGFWLHRQLWALGIENRVVDSSSIPLKRRARHVKTDRLDGQALVRLLNRVLQGERGVWSEVRVPSAAAEDERRLHREREVLRAERGQHRNRIRGLLVAQGVRWWGSWRRAPDWAALRLWNGEALGADLQAQLAREWERLERVQAQLRVVEAEQQRRVATAEGTAYAQMRQLLQLKAVGLQGAWQLVSELFGWRALRNRRQVAAVAGLTPTPYQSGDSAREQGISKAGVARVRCLVIELSWLWLRYQPDSALSQWYAQRFAHGGARQRRVGIVALARRLLVALWRYLQTGELPAGVVLKAV